MSAPRVNRQWRLAVRPSGMVGEEHFTRTDVPVAALEPDSGQMLVRNLYLSFDPAMRPWLDDVPSYLPPVAVNEVMRAAGIAEVVESTDPNFPVGSLVQGLFGWQDYAVVSADGSSGLMTPSRAPAEVPIPLLANVLGGTGLTAYIGMLEIAALSPGETVVVSGAAGATGSVALQIARIKGCRAVGIAGGEEKCAWLRTACRAHGVIDYRAGSVSKRLAEFCPDGIDVYFDNVGGAVLESAINHMAQRGRIVLCGSISQYNDEVASPGPRNLTVMIMRRLRMQGFIVMDHLERAEEARRQLAAWVAAGEIAHREDIQQGFENIPATLRRLFEGKNQGKQLLRLADPQHGEGTP